MCVDRVVAEWVIDLVSVHPAEALCRSGGSTTIGESGHSIRLSCQYPVTISM